MFPLGNQVLPRRRKRLTLSCLECRRRKIRCDRQKPCARCKTSKVDCEFEMRARSTVSVSDGSHHSTVDAELHLTPMSSASAHKSPISRNIASDFEPQRDDSLAIQQDSLWRRLIGSFDGAFDPCARKLEEMFDVNLHNHDIGAHEIEPAELDQFTSSPIREPGCAILNKTRVFGQGHWTNTAHEFQILTRSFACSTSQYNDAATNKTFTDLQTLLQKCKLLSREAKRQRPTRNNATKHEQVIHVWTSEFAEKCVNLYLGCFESVFRIVHVPTFRKDFLQFCTDPNSLSKAVVLKVQLIIAIGCSLCAKIEDEGDLIEQARSCVYTAQDWLAAPFEKSRLSISGIQVQCLLILARQTLSVGGNLVWISLGTLIHSAIQMGLNRDPSHFPNMPVSQAEMRKRLWATILELSLQTALDAGTIPTIAMDDFDTMAPANVDDSELNETTKVIDKISDVIVTDTSMQRILLISWPLRVQLLRCMNGLSTDTSYEAVLQMSTRLKALCNEIKLTVRPQDDYANFRVNLADLFLRRFFLSLHCSYAIRSRRDMHFYYSRKASTDAAMALLSPLQDATFSRLVLSAGGMFKFRLRHLGLALSSELMSDIHENGSSNTAYRKMLLQALEDTRSQAYQRIKFGDYNVRLYALLSLMPSRADYVGNPEANVRMAEAAKAALERAHEVIYSSLEKTGNLSTVTTMVDTVQDLPNSPSFPDLDFAEFIQSSSWDLGFGMDHWSTLL